MRGDTALRVGLLALLVAAVVDPGCSRHRPVPVVIEAASGASSAMVERVQRVVAAAGREAITAGAGPDAVRIGVGSPRDLLSLHRVQPLSIAVRADAAPAHISDLVVPRTMVVGLASVVRVRIAGAGRVPAPPAVVQIRDAGTGQRVGVSRPRGAVAPEGEGEGGGAGGWLDVDVLPVTAGRWPLCVAVVAHPDANEPVDCERAEVEVAEADVRVEILDARPSWVGRFARLALERWHDAAISSSVRVAPGVSVATRSSSTPAAGTPVDVTIVGGLDALASNDVERLVAAARDEGRVILLLADGAVDVARLRPLWPHVMRTVATVASPVAMRVGTQTWRVREWLAPSPMATDVEVLAYLDAAAPVPAVLSRPLGSGRVVLVTALDAWRWRLMDGVAFDEAWQALVMSLAADARLARAPRAWRVPGPLADEVHVALPAQPAADTPEGVGQTLRLAGTAAVAFAPESGGGARAVGVVPASVAFAQGVVDVSDRDAAPSSIDVGHAARVPATWDDVRRSLTADGGTVVDEAGLRNAIDRLSTGRMSDGTRWFLTRQWWFAPVVVAGLGLEWWWRRLARQA